MSTKRHIHLLTVFVGLFVFREVLGNSFSDEGADSSQQRSRDAISRIRNPGRKERERNRYQNSDGDKQGIRRTNQNVRSERQGQESDTGDFNPLLPPRSDDFWNIEIEDGQHEGDLGELGQQRSHFDAKRQRPGETRGRSSHSNSRPRQTVLKRPNIILILTDDQDIELGSMEYMPETLRIFREGGIEFRHGYVTTPMCCPSRSSILTGLYVHNHQVYTNNDNCSSIAWREKFESKTFAAYLQSSGYYTSYIGKYLNKYDGSHIPAGWDEWNALLMNSKFYNYTVNRNGENMWYGNNYERDYYPDSIANDTVNFLERMASTVRSEDNQDEQSNHEVPEVKKVLKRQDQPFLLVASFPSPHGPEDSAPQFSELFMNETPHHTPAYNYAPNRDKQWILQVTNKMNSNLKDFTNVLMSKRLQTLQSVDEAVKRIFLTLEMTGLLDDTYIFYTSDHGYHVGQFGLIKGKSMPFEFDIRVPFFLKPPPSALVAKGTIILEPILNIDLAPTFLELGGLPIPEDMDGRSVVPLIKRYSSAGNKHAAFDWTRIFLIESAGRRDIGNEHEDSTIPSTRAISTNSSDDEESELVELCDLHPYPCRPRQKKFCVREGDRIRFRKCRIDVDFQKDERERNCSCHTRKNRSAPDQFSTLSEMEWEIERRKIDAEIETLKYRIEELRERKRLMRQQWLNGGSIGKIIEKVPGNRTFLMSVPSFHLQKNRKNHIRISILKTVPSILDEIVEPIPTTTLASIDKEILELDEMLEDLDESHVEGPLEEEFETLPQTTNDNTRDETKSKDSEEHTMVTLRQENDKFSNLGLDRNGNIITTLHDNGTSEIENCNCFSSLPLDPKLLRQLEREERRRKKLMSKMRKKHRFLNRIRDPTERHQAETCGTEDAKVMCFWHDKQHWRTAPFWEGESFCFCMNSINNTFSCLRSINSTHNFLYCQFITGFKMYFDLGRDPFQLRNAIGNLPQAEEEWMIETLRKLTQCSGREECHLKLRDTRENTRTRSLQPTYPIVTGEGEVLESSIWETIFGDSVKRKRGRNGRQRRL